MRTRLSGEARQLYLSGSCHRVIWWFLFAVIVACTRTPCRCATPPSDPLLNLLLKKGILTDEEAQAIKAEAEASRTNETEMPQFESKWKFSKAIKSVEFFGDIRMRYEARSVSDPGRGSIDLNRYRYALRLGLKGEVLDDFYFGVRLDTAANPRSPWVTFGSSSSGTPYQGPFGKSTAGVDVGQVYLGWRPTDWFDFTIGKMANPLYTTAMVWDPDLNPEGAAERLKYTVGPVDLFATFGQFVYEDITPSKTSSGYFNILGYNNSSVPFLLAWQVGFNYHFTERLSFKAGPVIYDYIGHGASPQNQFNNPTPDFNGTFVGQGSSQGILGNAYFNLANGLAVGSSDGFFSNETGINNLLVLDVPMELNYKLNNIDIKLFGEYAENLEGSTRAQAAYNASQDTTLFPTSSGIFRIPSAQRKDVRAYQAGFAIGSQESLGLASGRTSRKNGWELRTYWQHVEQYALDPNLMDSDFFEGRGNLEGVYAALAYGFTDNFYGAIRYGYAKRINKNIGTGGSNQDIPQMNPIEHYDIIQVDVGFRF